MKKASKGSARKPNLNLPGSSTYPQRNKRKPTKKAAPRKRAGQARKAAPKRKPAKKPASSGWVRPILNWGGTAFLWSLLVGGLVLGYYAYTLPDISGIGVIEKRPSMVLQTSDGTRYTTYGDLYGEMLPIEQIPDVMKQAVLATEDSPFYDHFGPCRLAQLSSWKSGGRR
jgi:membrane peptidoglycan carboxypeptidase